MTSSGVFSRRLAVIFQVLAVASADQACSGFSIYAEMRVSSYFPVYTSFQCPALSRLGLVSPSAAVSFLCVSLQHTQTFIAWDIAAGGIPSSIES